MYRRLPEYPLSNSFCPFFMENIDAFLGGYFYNTQAKNIFSNTVTSYSVSAHVGGAKNDISTMVRGLDIPTLILVGEKNEHT